MVVWRLIFCIRRIGFLVQGMVLILERLRASLKDAYAAFPDKRKSEGVYFDGGLSACRRFRCFSCGRSRFCPTSARSRRGAGPPICQTLFGMAKIPTDNHIRSMLDPDNLDQIKAAPRNRKPDGLKNRAEKHLELPADHGRN
jgi:hypothetical protein